jgi:predicted acetyltransferase
MTALPADLEIRTIGEDEFPSYAGAVAMQFGETMEDDELAAHAARSELERSFACYEDGRIVGTAGNISFTMGLPWAAPTPCAGLTAVGVHPTRRRRGILTALMRRTIDDAVSREEPFAALYASEAGIYGRFGYGPAAPAVGYEIDAPHGRLRTPPDSVDDIRLVEADEAVALIPSIYRRVQEATPGMMLGLPRRWDSLRHDPAGWRDGATGRFHAVIDDRAYLVYRLKDGWRDGVPDGTVKVVALLASDPDAYASLWQYCMTMDLMPHVTIGPRPPDEPLRHALVDASRLRTRIWEPLYIRLLDLPTAMTSRGYRSEGSVVLEVRDAFCPWNEGRWRLEAGPDGAACERSDAAPDLTLDTSVLATAFLGGVGVRSLLEARRVDVHIPTAVTTLDLLLHSDRAPWNPEMF